MKLVLRSLGLATACLLVPGCADSRISGNSSETENTFAAREVSVDSLLPSWNHPSNAPTVATLRLDASNFDFSKADSTGQDVSVEDLDGASIPFERVFWDKQQARGRLRVRLDTALLNRQSRFLVRSGRDTLERSDPAAVWKDLPDSQKLALNSVHVDDFERGNMQNLLPITQVWYTGRSDSGKINWFTLGAASAKRGGNALGIGYTAKSQTGDYALIGTPLGPGLHSLRALDSLVFWARGSGTLAPSLDHWTGTRGFKARARVALDTTWKRIRIRPSDFESGDGIGGNIGWLQVRDSLTNLTFLVNGGSELWIDDVRLHGIDRDDLD